MIEITRSFNRKVALPKYENVDFFCSAKQTTDGSEDNIILLSKNLDLLCQEEVEKSIKLFKERELDTKEDPIKDVSPKGFTNNNKTNDNFRSEIQIPK